MLWAMNCNTLKPISPSEGETKSRVAESSSITSKSRPERQPGGHFTKRTHNQVDYKTDDRVGNQDWRRTSLREC